MQIKPYLVRIYLTTLLLFVLNKFVVRPLVLEHDFPMAAKVLVLSIPNAFEAVIGMSNGAAILMMLAHRFRPGLGRTGELVVYGVTTLLVAVFVLTQEFKLHDLGGRNVYDPFDAVASIIGIAVMVFLCVRCGVVEASQGSASEGEAA